MHVLAHQNNEARLIHKSPDFEPNTQMPNTSLILQVPSILNEKELKPYWNARSQELQSTLWLPHKIGSQDPGSISSNELLNYQVVQLNYLMKVLTPMTSIPQTLSVSLPRSVIPITESVQQLVERTKIVATKKIRVYPENAGKYHQMLCVYRRAYNIAVEKYKTGTYKDQNGKSIDIRPEIRSIVKSECEISGSVFDVNICDDAVRKAGQVFAIICNKNKKLKGSTTGFSEIHFKSRKGKIHTFTLAKMPKGHFPCVRSLGPIHITEEIPDEAIGKQVQVTYDHGRWYMNVQQHIEIRSEIQGEVRCVGIDPGSRTFGTCYSPSEAAIIGDGFAKEVLLPLAKKMRKLFSSRDRIQNQLKLLDEIPQWALDQLRYIEKELNRIECIKQDKIRDLHHRFAWYLVQNYDVIFLPTFSTSKMVNKTAKKRVLNRVAVSNMLSLQHYKFKQVLKWYARKYGKVVLDVNESYTSKTRSWDGTIIPNLGSAKIIRDLRDPTMVVDRDINAARGIFLKQLLL